MTTPVTLSIYAKLAIIVGMIVPLLIFVGFLSPTIITIFNPQSSPCSSVSQTNHPNELIQNGLYGVLLITYCNPLDFTTHSDVGIDQLTVWRDMRFSQLSDSINKLPNSSFAVPTSSSQTTLLNLVKDASNEVYYGEYLHAVSTLHKLEIQSNNLIVDPHSKTSIVSLVKGIEYTATLVATTGTPVKNIP
jgi:hypothetical protein